MFILALLGDVRHVTVPEDTLILIIECQPRPTLYESPLVTFASLARCVRGPRFHCYVGQWSSNPAHRTDYCAGVPAWCMRFDTDSDGDVDMLDYARILAPGPRKYTPHKCPRCSETGILPQYPSTSGRYDD